MTITASHANVIDGLRNDPIIQVMASRLTRIPLAELANDDGPLWDLVNRAHRTYAEKAANARAIGQGDDLYRGRASIGDYAIAALAERADQIESIRHTFRLSIVLTDAGVMTAFDAILAR